MHYFDYPSRNDTSSSGIAVKSTKAHEFNQSYLRTENSSTSAVVCAHMGKETVEVKLDSLCQAFTK